MQDMQRLFRKVNRKFSSDSERRERELTKAILVAAQFGFLGIAIYNLSQGKPLSAALSFAVSVYFEKIAVKIYDLALNDKNTAQYISDHYSSISKLPNIFNPAIKTSTNQMKEDIQSLANKATKSW